MKAKQILSCAGVILLEACRPSAPATCVEGELSGLESDTLLVDYFAVSDLRHEGMQTDTVTVTQQGKFAYAVKGDSVPVQLFFHVKPQGNEVPSLHKTVGVVAFPGQTVRISGSMDDCHVEGNEFHRVYAQVQEPYRKKLNRIAEVIMVYRKKETLTPERIDSLHKIYQPIYDEMMKVQKDYVVKHPDEDVSVYLLSKLGLHTAKELLPAVGEKARTGVMASLYREMEEALEKEKAREEAALRITEGEAAPDFCLKDIEGHDFSLSSLRGKYVVLDFWGSWCGWCIKGIPDMKKAYGQYKDRMEVVGVDCGDTEDKWKEAVEKHRLPWTQVRNSGNIDLTVVYAIKGYPTKIVIDREGKIAKVVVGEDPSFYAYLDSLLKK